METCVLCGKPIIGYPNEAYPLADGHCCDACNYSLVIPGRIRKYESTI